MPDKIYYTTNEIISPSEREEVYVHVLQHGIELRVCVPHGHDISDLDLAVSYGDGWIKINQAIGVKAVKPDPGVQETTIPLIRTGDKLGVKGFTPAEPVK